MTFLGQHPGILFRKVREHRIANNIPIRHMEQEIIDQFCETQPEWCEDVDERGRPTLAELASRFSRAMFNWARAGFKIVDEKEYQRRSTICQGCQWWRGEGNVLGSALCGKCGCSSLKIFVATEKCPAGKWEEEA